MKQQKSHTGINNIYAYTALKFLVALLFLWVTQILFHAFNPRIFHLEGLGEWLGVVWGNVRFGTATVAMVLAPYLVMMLLPIRARYSKPYRTVAEILYIISVVALMVVNLIDTAYYQFTYRRMSNEMFSYMGIGGDMGNLIPQFLRDYWYVTISGVVLFSLFFWFQCKMRLSQEKHKSERTTAVNWLGCVMSLAVLFVLLRGGVRKQFISLDEAARYCQLKNAALVTNSPYCILRTLGVPDLKHEEWMTKRQAVELFNPRHTLTAATASAPTAWAAGAGMRHSAASDSTALTQRKNVVVIVLESFSQEYMGCYNNGIMESYTPFLDSLARRSYVYQGRSNGKKSIESIPAIMASVPSWMNKPYILSAYRQDSVMGLPSCLRRYGYHTAFFHGAYNGSMDFDKFCKQAGFEAYHGKNEYAASRGEGVDYDGTWGIFDEPFLQYMVEQLDSLQEPFMSGVFTISSHHPYKVPEAYEGKFRKGEHPILQTVMYTDHALRTFFAEASKRSWYRNTLFVIMADHPAQGLHRPYNDSDGWYRIPMIFFDPEGEVSPIYSTDIVQQTDVMPTILDFLCIDEPCITFGQSVFEHGQDNQGWNVVYGNGYYQLERNGRVAAISPYKSFGEENDIAMLKAVVQQYTYRMINDKLIATRK